MDTLSHAVIGAAVCSKTGLGGGLKGPRDAQGRPKILHWTLWAAFLFGLLPDLASLGWYLVLHFPEHGNQTWRILPPYIFTLYNWTHSLVIITPVLVLLYFIKRPLLLPALAWPLHIVVDVFTHGKGRFTTPLFWPISDMRFYGINWWEHGTFWLASWGVIIALCIAIIAFRLTQRAAFKCVE